MDTEDTKSSLSNTADKEESLADIIVSALHRIEVLESKLNTYQGLDILAIEIEKRLITRLRNNMNA